MGCRARQRRTREETSGDTVGAKVPSQETMSEIDMELTRGRFPTLRQSPRPFTGKEATSSNSNGQCSTLPAAASLASTPQHSTKPHNYHPVWSYRPTSPARQLLTSIYDCLIITILSLHIFAYVSNVAFSKAFCNTFSTLHHPDWTLPDAKSNRRRRLHRPANPSMQERCENVIWTLHSAGTLSAMGAGALAIIHVSAMLLRAWQHLSPQLERRKAARRIRREELESETWKHRPRHVDICARALGTDASGVALAGQLTAMLEEEQNTGVRRRGDRSSSKRASEEGNGSEQNQWLEALLECLMP